MEKTGNPGENHSLEEVTMQVSGICRKDGEKYAYVTFSDGKRHAEGTIPDCKIKTQEGFDEAEIGQLELFMKMNLANLKRKAASIDPVRAMMNSGKPDKNR